MLVRVVFRHGSVAATHVEYCVAGGRARNERIKRLAWEVGVVARQYNFSVIVASRNSLEFRNQIGPDDRSIDI